MSSSEVTVVSDSDGSAMADTSTCTGGKLKPAAMPPTSVTTRCEIEMPDIIARSISILSDAGRKEYSVVFMSGSGSSIIGISSSYPLQCVNDEDEDNDIFISKASVLSICHDLLAFSISEIKINVVGVYGIATVCGTLSISTISEKISVLNLMDKASLMQCPQAVRRNVNEGFDTKFVGLGDKPVGTSIIVMIQANIAKENAENDGTRNTMINMLLEGLKVWYGNPIMFSRYDTSISEITPDRTTKERRHAGNLLILCSVCLQYYGAFGCGYTRPNAEVDRLSRKIP